MVSMGKGQNQYISFSSVSFLPLEHYGIAKELEINKAPMLSVVVLKWSPYFIDQFKTTTLSITSKLQLLELKYCSVVRAIYEQNGELVMCSVVLSFVLDH